MMGRRVGRPGLIGTVARTAVIAGTAQATSNAVNRRQMARAEERAQASAYQQEQAAQAYPPAAPAPAPAAAAPADAGDDLIAQLTRLGELHQQGLLSDEEFAAAKQRLLA
ncbi:SHOCT domain-containing protein [Nocardioides sp. YIM 152315]|uniref:SHOCT domain-containing protein n=1 Tax=Nocardioides sp. YIM 152315 TaxID=3031760 RepID=UPI0023DC0F3E|nr:SHOCT domain-containing protein [Nocardioides sp. YIM 152315]MDF1602874.1 SHOCT domain-containing protein [Nocardioides sp. YIM 152315]